MTDTIVTPALAELRQELDRLDAARALASARNDADPNNADLTASWAKALSACWAALDQISVIPASSLADLRVKAYAFDWSARLLDGEPYGNPTAGEEHIMRQLVSGLLDEALR